MSKPTSLSPAIDRPEPRPEIVAPKRTYNATSDQVRRVTYRGSEEVINIGEDLDVDASYYAPEGDQNVVDIGPQLDPDQD